MDPRLAMHQTIGALLDGKWTGEAAIATLAELTPESLTAAQIAGAVDAVMARMVPFPAFPDAVDCCGTGGDGLHTVNISTAVALVVAGAGVPVAKHGNRAVTSRSGSADVLEALGVRTDRTAQETADQLTSHGIAFLFAPQFHSGFARVVPLRKAVGKRTIFNLLGPLCNPARVERQVMGVFSPDLCTVMAEAALLLGRRRVLVVHGAGGEDELSIAGESLVVMAEQGRGVRRACLTPEAFGLPEHPSEHLRGGDAASNAAALEAVLRGEPSAYADAVLLNAAALLWMAEEGALGDAVARARESVASGAAMARLQALRGA